MKTLRLVFALCVCLFAASANADYVSNFENLAGLPTGMPLTGQDGFYIPAGTTSEDCMVYTYIQNSLGVPQNPNGNMYFVAGTGPGGTIFARGQRDVAVSGGTYVISYDFCGTFMGATAANNIGSFSLRAGAEPGSGSDYIHLMSWVLGYEGTHYNAFYMAYDLAGTQFAQPGLGGGPDWEMLPINHWYRARTVIDFNLNMIVEIGIEDLDTGIETVYVPTDWFLEGGATGSTLPTFGFRFFGGGSSEGNSLCFDNMDFSAAGATAVLPATWGSIKSSFK